MLFERQPLGYHKRPYALTSESLALLGCLSLLLFLGSANAQVTNPSTGDTIARYCSNGVCNTGGTPVINHTATNHVLTFPKIKPNLIGIQLSSTCFTYAKNNMKSSCFNYKDLLQFDNTNQYLAGKFTDKPYFHRLPSPVKNFWAFLDQNAVMVDPSREFTINAKMIIVNPQNFTWIDPSEDGLKGGQLARYHENRLMNGCDEAQVSSNYTLIRDTIIYMSSNCTVTSFNNTKTITQKEIPFTYNNPYSSLHLSSYLGTIFNHHSYFTGNHTASGLGPSNCITHKCTYTDPYAKQGYK